MIEKKINIANFETIAKEYQTMVFRVAIGFLHHKEDAEDLTQEVFIKAFNSWSNFRGESEVSTWLYRITINLSLNYIEKKQRKKFLFSVGESLKNFLNKKNEQADPQQELEVQEVSNAIKKAIDSLPEKQRIAFILSKYNDLTQKKVAEIMNISEGAVEQLLHRAKNNLQKKLAYIVGKTYN